MTSEASEYSQCDCPKVTVAVVVFAVRSESLQVLLVRRDSWPFEGLWSIPGNGVGHNESLEAAATQRLQSETGLSPVFMEQLGTFGEPRRDPRQRVITVAYVSMISGAETTPRPRSNTSVVRWWPTNGLPALAFDHAEIIDLALKRLRSRLQSTAVALELLPCEFTLTELQRVYEILLGEVLDKRNFRRRILGASVIEASGRYRTGEGRPARLYRCRGDTASRAQASWQSPF